jgi:murein DD-endopeptidase MepM/ murein hydrolase activator NlpD
VRLMRKAAKVVAAILLISAALVVAPNSLALGAPQEIDLRIDELNQLQVEIDELQKKLQSTASTEKSVLAELSKLESQLALANKELDYIEVQLSVTDSQINKTKAEVQETEEKLASQKAAFDSRLLSMYKASRISYLDMLLSSGSLSELMARMHYLKQIAVQDSSLIDEYCATREALLAKQADLEAYQTKLVGLKASQERKRAEVTSRSLEREEYLNRVQADKQKYAEALDQMQKEADALNKIIADLQAKGQKPQAHPLQMIWPISGGGWISSEYGSRYHPILGYNKWHSGIDYAANRGTPIKAAEDGTVILAGVNGGYGNCVIIDHGGGVSTLYGHADKLLVKTGQDVIKGQTIALVGSTGLSTGPHLHFEVRVNGETQDPLKWAKP